MSLLAALAVYSAMTAGGWALAGTAGVVAALAVVLLVEHHLAKWRALTPIRQPRETDRARR